MKQFFRLLLISFGLLFLLSMDGHTPPEIADNNSPIASAFSFSDHHVGLIPGALTDALPLSKNWSLVPEGQSTTAKQNEIITSAGIRTRLHFFKESFLQYSPAVLQKKGIHIFLPPQKDDHFLI